MGQVDPKAVRKETLINYLHNHYEELTKKTIFDVAVSYIKAVYLKNGNIHVDATNEALKEIGENETE